MIKYILKNFLSIISNHDISNMNLNNPSTSYSKFYSPRTKTKKQAELRICKKEGKEENLNAVCSYCELRNRTVEKKDVANPHYGCVEKCCRLLHYWDMCSFCIQEVHLSGSQSDEKRPTEVARFQRGVSRLPDDVQRYIGEFVPQIFSFVCSFGTLRRNGQFFASLDKYVKLPKSTWEKAHYSMITVFAAFHLSKNANRQQICEAVKQLYKEFYQINSRKIREDDFWQHKLHNGIGFHARQMRSLKEIQTIFTK